jgi:DNA-binding CsgD family transcriptional regulator
MPTVSMLTWRHHQAAQDLAREVADADTAADFISAATAGLQAALDIDVAAYCVWHPQSRRPGRVIIAPEFSRPSADQVHVWEQHHPEDLWISYATRTREFSAVRLTDIASSPQLSASPTYQSCYKPSGFRFMAHAPLALEPGTSAAVGIGRQGRDLDDDVMGLFGALSGALAGTRCRLLRDRKDMDCGSVPGVAENVENIWIVRGRVAASLPHGQDDPRRLTSRQEEVMQLVAAGLGNKQIANSMGISYGTAKKHISDILRRLEAPSRSAAIARWKNGPR